MLEYELRGNLIAITGCSKDEENLEIPDTIDNLPVSRIDPNTFNSMPNVKRLVVPGTCKVIGAYAFAGCENLREIVIEDGVEVIEDWAFISCNIESISLPQTLKTVGNNAFLGTRVKKDVEDFMEKMSSLKRPRNHTNNKCCVLPLEMRDHMDKVDDQFIQEKSKYIDNQFDLVTQEVIKESDIDLPLIFDGEHFLLAIYNRKPIEDIKVEITSDTNTSIGLYTLNDPEFITLRVNVNTKGLFLTSFVIRTPYLEAAEFQKIKFDSRQLEGMYYYFVELQADLSCFGNGNYENEFALNQYNVLLEKYETKLKYELITKAQMDLIQNTVSEKITNTVYGFLTQLDNAPRLLYFLNLIQKVMEDPAEDKGYDLQNVINVFNNFITDTYNNLSSVESLRQACITYIDDYIIQLEDATQLTNDILAQKYDVTLSDSVGNVLDLDDAYKMEDKFLESDVNFKLHAEYLNYIYNEMRIMNQEFQVFEFEKLINNSVKKED